ncbi:MAG: ABC transporter permease [Dehalococcoidia bacterium]|nr:ABC transporter permease [Dehalococcoidia bacterium]
MALRTAKNPPVVFRGAALSSPALARRLRRAAPALGYILPPLVALTLLALGWELWVRIAGTPTYIMPAPTEIWARLTGDLGFFAWHGWVTLYEALAGCAIGSAVAIALAITMAHSRALERSIYPLAVLVKVTPIVAVAPLFVIWFGFGSWPKMLIAALITFFPVMVNAVVGLRSVSPGALDFLRSVDASPREIFWRLRWPASFPYLFAALRIVAPLAVIGAVVGEWFTGDRGLGSVIIVAHNNLDMPTLFAAIVTLAVIGISLMTVITIAERRLLFWHESSLSQ